MFRIAILLVFLSAQWRSGCVRCSARIVESEGLQRVRLPVGFCSKRHGTGGGCCIGLVVVGHRLLLLRLLLLAEVLDRGDGRWPLAVPVDIEGVFFILVDVIVGVS